MWDLLKKTVNKFMDNKDNKDTSPRNELDKIRMANIQQSKDLLYQKCYNACIKHIPDCYTKNIDTCQFHVEKTSEPVDLEFSTANEVLIKASYDAMKELNITPSTEPTIGFSVSGAYTVKIKFDF